MVWYLLISSMSQICPLGTSRAHSHHRRATNKPFSWGEKKRKIIVSKDRYSAMTKQISDRGETRKENASHWRQNGKLTRLCFVNDGSVRKKRGNLIGISGRPSERRGRSDTVKRTEKSRKSVRHIY